MEDKVRVLLCFHPFHLKCIDDWLSKKCECPLCKMNLPSEQDSYIVGSEMLSYKYSQTIANNKFMVSVKPKKDTDASVIENSLISLEKQEDINIICIPPKNKDNEMELDLDLVNYRRLKESMHITRPFPTKNGTDATEKESANAPNI